MNMDEILLKSNKKMISKQGKWADFTDDFHALFGYILGKYRLSRKGEWAFEVFWTELHITQDPDVV